MAAFPSASRFLRIPPFPGARVPEFLTSVAPSAAPSLDEFADALRRCRVGGNYWVPTPRAANAAVLVRSSELSGVAAQVAAQHEGKLVLRPDRDDAGDGDLWTLLDGALAVVCKPDDPARIVAALLEVPVYCDETGKPDADALTRFHSQMTSEPALTNPFDGQPMDLLAAIELCGFWREMVESNQDIAGALGFAFWKQQSVGPLLWNGDRPLAFWRHLPTDLPAGAVAVWRSKARAQDVDALEGAGAELVEVEDGFLRSAGLGADCIPPLSLTVDRLGAYFDPSRPSGLEELLQNGDVDDRLVARAAVLRTAIVDAGLGKYERGRSSLERFSADRAHIVVPGQVEDDRSVMTGGGGMSNMELLRRVRMAHPHAFIIYKPHPDVEAGHRRGAIAAAEAEELADRIIADAPIASLLEVADEVHVNTSLTGFEALMRGKSVTTHGVPFYAGWGLTTDLGPVPARRTRKRTLDELVAAALLVYPRYLDPVSGLPCPAEVVVQRLVSDQTPRTGTVVRLRRWQGKIARRLRMLVG